MKHSSCIFVFCACMLLVSFSCKKKKITVSGGGKGGSAIITAIPEHHGYLVDTCTVYIKYGTLDAPANGIYDDSAKVALADTIPEAIFSGLTTGSYYLLGLGYHTLDPGHPHVAGATPVTISVEDSQSVYLYMADQ